jgi:hypothetical protein
MVSDLTFSWHGGHIAALAKENDRWTVVVDDQPWRENFDMVWPPVFSDDGQAVAVKVEKDGKYSVAVNDCLWHRRCDMVWPPQFSPDGRRLLVCCLEEGVFHRRIVPVSDIIG